MEYSNNKKTKILEIRPHCGQNNSQNEVEFTNFSKYIKFSNEK
jgi:hypothetical protein